MYVLKRRRNSKIYSVNETEFRRVVAFTAEVPNGKPHFLRGESFHILHG